MKRDMDLVRTILLTLEEDRFNGQDRGPSLAYLDIPGYDLREYDNYTKNHEKVFYHLLQLTKADLIASDGDLKNQIFVRHLTWEGHEFLDAARNQERWNQARTIIRDRGGNLSFEILKGVLTQLARQAVGL